MNIIEANKKLSTSIGKRPLTSANSKKNYAFKRSRSNTNRSKKYHNASL